MFYPSLLNMPTDIISMETNIVGTHVVGNRCGRVQEDIVVPLIWRILSFGNRSPVNCMKVEASIAFVGCPPRRYRGAPWTIQRHLKNVKKQIA